MPQIISIDPSTRDVGWAVIEKLKRDKKTLVWDDTDARWRYGNWVINAHSLQAKFQEIAEYMIMEFDINPEEDIMVLEWPAYFGSEKGQVAAQLGHTLNLAGVVGYCSGYFRIPWQRIHLITANQWKGSVSKEVTKMRFFRAMGVKQIFAVNHNAVDAVMLLFAYCKEHKITFKIVTEHSLPDLEALT